MHFYYIGSSSKAVVNLEAINTSDFFIYFDTYLLEFCNFGAQCQLLSGR